VANREKRLDCTLKRVGRSSGLQLSELESGSGRKVPVQGLRKEPKILNSEALQKLLKQLREPYRSMLILAALTGLRVGELLALRWRMVDLTVGTIRISESVFHGQVQLPKSERSIRTIPIGPQTRVLLEEHRARFATNWSEEGLLFPNHWADHTAKVIS